MALRGIARGPGHAEGDPLPEYVNLARFELAVGGHFQAIVTDGFDQQAFVRLSGDGGRAAVAASENGLARGESQPAFDFFDRRSVAFVAVFGQQRTHALFEELRAIERCVVGTAPVALRWPIAAAARPAISTISNSRTARLALVRLLVLRIEVGTKRMACP